MESASLLAMALLVIASALLLFGAVGKGAFHRTWAGMRRNWPWLILLVAATAIERGSGRLTPDHPYLLKMSPPGEILAGVPVWLQSVIPSLFGTSFFGTIYIAAFLVCLIVLPLYLLAAGEDTIFRRYCLSISLAYLLLIVLHLAILSVRPGLDPASGIAGLLYFNPFWGPFSQDLISRGNSLPSGHVISLTASAVAIWPLKRPRTEVLVLLSLTVVAVLYLGIHWPVDVIAGLLLGAASGLAAIKIIEKWERKKFRRSRPGSP